MASSHTTRLISALCLGGLFSLNILVSPGWANQNSQRNPNSSQGLPGRRLGGGTRSQLALLNGQNPLTALIPETNLAITTLAYPSLLFYIPEAEEPQTVEFVLRNQADELVYETTFSVDKVAGITGIDLANAEGMMPLAVNQNYQWYFSVVAEDRAQDVAVEGWVRRVNLEDWIHSQNLDAASLNELANAPLLEQAKLLQEVNLWNDAASLLYTLQQSDPANPSTHTEWIRLLRAVGLEAVSQMEIIGFFQF